MKPLKCFVTAVVVVGSLILVLSCNQAEDPATLSAVANPSAALAAGGEVEVNIQPHHPTSRVNCKAKNRLIAVGIMTTSLFDATTVDHATVNFEGAYEAHLDPDTGEPVRHEYDVDEDGDKDLILHFLYRKTDLDCGSTQGCLTGKTFGGDDIWGCDDIDMFPQ